MRIALLRFESAIPNGPHGPEMATMAKAEPSTDDSDVDEVAQFEIAHKSDLDGIELKQGSVRLKSTDTDQQFRLSDHETGYTINFCGVERKNGRWAFLVKRDDNYTVVNARRDYPTTIEVVLSRIADLTDEA